MLILAGVSLNAIIGDNGIITRAQEANIQSSIASLEEYLQLKYTENYEEMTKYQSKIEGLTNVCSEYFYIPIKEGIGGLWYVVDSDGHALYLIKKSGLPEEIRESLVGGDAGEGSYADYQSLNDVYGVTTNLKVYYCSGGVDSIKGLARESLDSDNPLREVFDESSKMAGLLSGYDVNNDGKINAEEVKSVKTFTIDEKSGITNLSDLYNLNGLQELTLQNIKLDSFSGIENCSQINYICLENFTSDDYSKINSLENKLQYLYLINTTDDEVKKLCSPDKGIAKGAFSKLQYFALSGYKLGITDSKLQAWGSNGDIHNDKLTDISVLSNLNTVTKEAIKYLFLNNNSIGSITCLENFKNIYLLKVETNKLTTLKGVKKMENLTYLCASYNNLGMNENLERKELENDSLSDLADKSKLYFVNLSNNDKLIWIDYLKNDLNIKYFYLLNCGSLSNIAVSEIKNIYNSCSSTNRSINSNFEKYLSGDDIFIYTGLTESDTNDINYLINLSQENKNKVKKFDLSGSTLSNDKLNEILKGYNGIICLRVSNCTELSSFDFLEGKNELEQILFNNTKITGNEVAKLDKFTACCSFSCDNPGIDVTAMQETLNRTYCYVSQYCFSSYVGAGLQGVGLLEQLPDCDNLTSICTNGSMRYEGITLDMSETNLKTLYDQTTGVNWILPTCFKGSGYFPAIFYAKGNSSYKFSGKTDVECICINQCADYGSKVYDSLLSSLVETGSTIKSLVISAPNNVNKFITFLSSSNFKVALIKNLTVTKPNAQMDISQEINTKCIDSFKNLTGLATSNYRLQKLDFLKDCTNLTSLDLGNCGISDISGIENDLNLNTLNLPNNSISNVKFLQNLKKLVSLNLENNSLQSVYSYDEDGTTKSIKNLQILADLNKNVNKGGALEKLYLSGNSLLTLEDYNLINSLTWTGRSGF